jgi:hypothetical protein
VRNGDHDELAAAHDLVGVEHGNAGQHRFDAVAVGARRDADEGVSGAGQRAAPMTGPTARADDPDTQPARAVTRSLRSSMVGRSSSASATAVARTGIPRCERSSRPAAITASLRRPLASRRPSHRCERSVAAADDGRRAPSRGVSRSMMPTAALPATVCR